MFKLNGKDSEGAPNIITIKIPPINENSVLGEESVEVRFPTDSEWCKRTSSLLMEQQDIGRGKTTTSAKNGIKVNADLFRRICLDASGINDFTASWVIDQLENCELVSIESEQSIFIVKLRVRGGIVTHYLNTSLMTQDKVVDYRRRRSDVVRNGNVIEVRSHLEPAGILYDKVAAAERPPKGYLAGVPIIHKSVVVEAVLDEINKRLADYNDEDEDDDNGDDNGPNTPDKDKDEDEDALHIAMLRSRLPLAPV